MTDATLGDRELDVMSILWEIGSGTVAEVRDRLDDPLAYTTVLTVLRNLENKRFVRREEEGRAHRYFPRVAQETAQKNALTRLLSRLFDGSPQALISQLVDQNSVSASELQAIARELNQEKDVG